MRSVVSSVVRGLVPMLGLMFGFGPMPAGSATAQAVARADLVGTWIHVDYVDIPGRYPPTPSIYFLALRADSTWSTAPVPAAGVDSSNMSSWIPRGGEPAVTGNNGGYATSGRWYHSGDSLWFVNPSTTYTGRTREKAKQVRNMPDLTYKVGLQDQQLVLGLWSFVTDTGCGKRMPEVFKRIDPSKPITVPPLPALPLTIKPADLVGSWVSANSSQTDAMDTLTFRADSTVTAVQHRPPRLPITADVIGKWSLSPGDKLNIDTQIPADKAGKFGAATGFSWYGKIILQGQQLLLQQQCDTVVYKHATP